MSTGSSSISVATRSGELERDVQRDPPSVRSTHEMDAIEVEAVERFVEPRDEVTGVAHCCGLDREARLADAVDREDRAAGEAGDQWRPHDRRGPGAVEEHERNARAGPVKDVRRAEVGLDFELVGVRVPTLLAQCVPRFFSQFGIEIEVLDLCFAVHPVAEGGAVVGHSAPPNLSSTVVL